MASTVRKRNSTGVEIRLMELDDLPGVFHLGETLFTSEQVPTLYRTWDEFEVTGLYQTDPELCLVAELRDELVGFALGTTILKPRSAWKYGHLVWLGVSRQCQRRGVGKRLFQRFRDLMLKEGVRMLLVDTQADNEPSIDFFRRMGFANPEAHIYMALNLGSRRRTPRARG